MMVLEEIVSPSHIVHNLLHLFVRFVYLSQDSLDDFLTPSLEGITEKQTKIRKNKPLHHPHRRELYGECDREKRREEG